MIESYKLMLAAAILTVFGAIMNVLNGNINMGILFGILAVFFVLMTLGLKRRMKKDEDYPIINNDDLNAMIQQMQEENDDGKETDKVQNE